MPAITMGVASMVITFAIPIRSFQTPVRKVATPENGGAIVLMTAMAAVLVCGGPKRTEGIFCIFVEFFAHRDLKSAANVDLTSAFEEENKRGSLTRTLEYF